MTYLSYWGAVTVARWEVEFYRSLGENPVVEELRSLRKKNVEMATEWSKT